MCAFCDELIIYRSGLLWDECRFVTSSEALCLMGCGEVFRMGFIRSGTWGKVRMCHGCLSVSGFCGVFNSFYNLKLL